MPNQFGHANLTGLSKARQPAQPGQPASLTVPSKSRRSYQAYCEDVKDEHFVEMEKRMASQPSAGNPSARCIRQNSHYSRPVTTQLTSHGNGVESGKSVSGPSYLRPATGDNACRGFTWQPARRPMYRSEPELPKWTAPTATEKPDRRCMMRTWDGWIISSEG